MKVGFLSDAHGNPDGLALCLRYLLESAEVERVFFLGDAVGYLPAAGEVLAQLGAGDVTCLLGNHDAMLLGRLPIDAKRDEVYRIAACREALTEEDVETLRGWPSEIEATPGGKRLLLMHGSPWEKLTGYVYPDADLERFAGLGADVVVMGHTHRPFVRRAGETLVVNPGSCGLPRDHGALASCAVYDTEAHAAFIARLEMNVEVLCRRFGEAIHPSVRDCLMRLPESQVVGQIVA